jgi:acyl-CoA reductase-like NAD-dependent aldehyde dehydrogenase
MRHPGVSFVLATGGASLVRAAYSSGTPAIGVGPCNAPAWVCVDADPDLAAEAIVASKSFDNGLACASEHNLVVDRAIRPAFLAALERRGAAVPRPGEARSLVEAVFDPAEGHVRDDFLGRSATHIAEAAGIRRPGVIRLLVVPASLDQVSGPFGRETLAPVLSLFTVGDDDEGLAVCKRLLATDGLGHTAIIHTADEARVERFGREVPASRILVNAPGVHGSLGLCTGLVPSMTLGCGTFGGTSTTDNVTYTHLLNVKRVAYAFRAPPADAESLNVAEQQP